MNRLKIMNIVGARPNLPKIAPLIREMRRYPEVQSILVHTGQHYDDTLNDVFFRQMEIPSPDENLRVGSGTHAVQTAEILKRIEPVLLKHKPRIVLVVGDVNSTVAVSLAAAKLVIPIAHVEAGLRSFDRAQPEEVNRVLTDALADFLFVTEEQAIDNLLREGRPRESIFFVGNVMIDSLCQFKAIASKSTIGQKLGLAQDATWSRFVVLTLHRPSNVDSAEKLDDILGAINRIAARIPIVFPVHPRTREALLRTGFSPHPNFRLIEPLGYVDFLCLLSHATFVLTDSGGIQEETTALGVPCLTLRENTERPVTISQGTNQLVGTNPEKIIASATNLLADPPKRGVVPPLWDGHAAERIVEILLRVMPGRNSRPPG
jgi:UDP-N-acetylglucosamine 2-epimerase (non-hydrolysing)